MNILVMIVAIIVVSNILLAAKLAYNWKRTPDEMKDTPVLNGHMKMPIPTN